MAVLAPIAELEKLVTAGDLTGTAALCESFELDLCHSEETQPISLAVYKVHMLSYMLTDQINACVGPSSNSRAPRVPFRTCRWHRSHPPHVAPGMFLTVAVVLSLQDALPVEAATSRAPCGS